MGLAMLASSVEPVLRLNLEDGVLGRTPKNKASTLHLLPFSSVTKPRRLPQNLELTLILLGLCGKVSHDQRRMDQFFSKMGFLS